MINWTVKGKGVDGQQCKVESTLDQGLLDNENTGTGRFEEKYQKAPGSISFSSVVRKAEKSLQSNKDLKMGG